MRQINFIFGVHNHQPLGNFDFVLEDAYNKAYLPFFETLKKYPNIKVMVHFSGCLIDWLEKNKPEYFTILSELIKVNQIEIMGGGYYEPILPMIPENDRIVQLKKMENYIKDKFGSSPGGIWLAERVWEPFLAKTLAQADVKYTVLDDFHFKCAGLDEKEIDGYYITEHEGYPVRIFPISEALRYKIPFASPEETIDYLRSRMNDDPTQLIAMLDDGEKYGVWPNTYKHVYEDGWLERFFTLLEQNRDWLKMRLCSEFMEEVLPRTMLQIPDNAYFEMSIWSLPAKHAFEFEQLQKEIDSRGEQGKYKMFLKGGFWRGFLSKYPEANLMQKWMQDLSYRIESLKNSEHKKSVHLKNAYSHLLQSQCNCPYWHGVFGGLYLPHLRHAVFSEIVDASKCLDMIKHEKHLFIETEIKDFDCDGKEEIIVKNSNLDLILKPSYGGSLILLALKNKSFNLLNTISRKYEHYHVKILRKVSDGSEGMSIHDLKRNISDDIRHALSYDWHMRYTLLDHFFGENLDLNSLQAMNFIEEGDFVNQPYTYKTKAGKEIVEVTLSRHGHLEKSGRRLPFFVEKKIRLAQNEAAFHIDYSMINKSDEEIVIRPGIEWNIFLLGGNDPTKSIRFGAGDPISPLSNTYHSNEVNNIEVRDESLGFSIDMKIKPEADCYYLPIQTVSQSESGYDLIYQGSSIVPCWKLTMKPGEKLNIKIDFKITD